MLKDIKPMYAKIIEDYKMKILKGDLREDDRLPSELDVASLYGVSRITSKRAFDELEREGYIYRIKGSGSYVCSKYNNDISTEVADQMKIIEIILPFHSSFGRAVDLICGANKFLEEKGFVLKIQNTYLDPDKEKGVLVSLKERNIAGAIYYPSSNSKNIDIIEILNLQNYPIVSVDKYYDGVTMDYIVSDNVGGSYAAVTSLIESGHTHIGFLSGIGLDDATSVRDRFFGYCKSLKDNGLELRHENYRINYFKELITDYPRLYQLMSLTPIPKDKEMDDYFKRLLSQFLDRNDNITAIHTVNDYNAIYVMKTALQMGVKVPEELSLIGYDNIELSEHIEVPLTTIEQDFFQMGYKAASLLCEIILGEYENKQKIILPVKMIKRESVADLRKNEPMSCAI
jgi:GntR family transcriptional regulator of arabinose operon